MRVTHHHGDDKPSALECSELTTHYWIYIREKFCSEKRLTYMMKCYGPKTGLQWRDRDFSHQHLLYHRDIKKVHLYTQESRRFVRRLLSTILVSLQQKMHFEHSKGR